MIRSVLLALAACLLLSGCGDTVRGKSVAEAQVQVFHDRLNAKKFEEIYANAGEAFRKASNQDQVLSLFAAIERKLGRVTSAQTTGWNVKTFNFVTTVVLVQQVKFERGNGTEQFTFQVSGDQATLVGYNINSLEMMTR